MKLHQLMIKAFPFNFVMFAEKMMLLLLAHFLFTIFHFFSYNHPLSPYVVIFSMTDTLLF